MHMATRRKQGQFWIPHRAQRQLARSHVKFGFHIVLNGDSKEAASTERSLEQHIATSTHIHHIVLLTSCFGRTSKLGLIKVLFLHTNSK